MSTRVVEEIHWRGGGMDSSSVHDLRADYAYVATSSDLSNKADLTYVNQKLKLFILNLYSAPKKIPLKNNLINKLVGSFTVSFL